MVSKEYISKGIRFGFFIGEVYINDIVFKNVNRKYFWRVSKKIFFLRFFIIGGKWSLKNRFSFFLI